MPNIEVEFFGIARFIFLKVHALGSLQKKFECISWSRFFYSKITRIQVVVPDVIEGKLELFQKKVLHRQIRTDFGFAKDDSAK